MTLADQIAALQNQSTAELAAEFERLHGRKPRYRSVPWMRKRIAHQLQVAAFGGLSRVAQARIAELNAAVQLPPRRDASDRGELRPGQVLVREWRGQQVRVEVLPDGFTWNGQRYGSLSAVAFAVTGARWNGRLFFNLVGRPTKP